MKKRYVTLFAFTSLMIFAILISKPILQRTSTQVTLYEVKPIPVDETVTCTGRVEPANSKEVLVKMPCIAGNVNVKAGDTVTEGDILFSIDTQATKQVLASANGIDPAMIADDKINKDVTAPMSGVVRTLNVSPGETINSDTPCAVISENDALQVKIAIHENHLKNIEIGQKAFVSGTAFKKNGYTGRVTYISPSARQQYVGATCETVVDAIITLSEQDASLKPGLSAKTKIQINHKPDCVIIPYEYVLQDDSNHEYVYVYEDDRAVKKTIVTGKELADGYEIVSGLSIGEQVIQNPEIIKRNDEKVSIYTEGAAANG